MKTCFISHSTKDEIGPLFTQYLRSLGIPSKQIFCSSSPENGVDASKQWFDEIFERIRSSEVVFLIASPNFMRSGISLLEAGAAIGTRKEVIILAFPNVNFSELANIFHGHQIIDFSNEDRGKQEFARAVNNHLLDGASLEQITNTSFDAVLDKMKEHCIADITTPPIAFKSEYDSIFKATTKNGITGISFETVDIGERLRNAKRIRIITTTGIGLFRHYISEDHRELEHALKNGCRLEVLIGNPSGELFHDVELLEKRQEGQLDEEFRQVVYLLSSIAKQTNGESGGKVYVGNVGTALRQTAIMVSDSSDGNATWGWCTVTLPPSRCNVHSMSLELIPMKGGTLQSCEAYFDEIFKKAKESNELYCLNDGSFECFRYEGAFALRKWETLQETALETMRESEALESQMLLIECAAQHPLLPNGRPGKEFCARLDQAIALYKEYTDKEWGVRIYVPGSLHRIKNARGEYVNDSMPLAESGKKYLIEKGIPEGDIFADDANRKYKGEEGVYCSADECYVASKLFFDGGFQRIICICSPAQLMRKALYYLLLSLAPTMMTASPNGNGVQQFHKYPYEAIVSIPEVIAKMDDMQSNTCTKAIEMRKERNPNYQC